MITGSKRLRTQTGIVGADHENHDPSTVPRTTTALPPAQQTQSTVRWWVELTLQLALLAGLVFLVYFGMWRAYFATLDDFGITGWVRSRSSLWAAIQGYGSGVRFLNYVPIWFKSQAFGLNAAPYLWSGLAQYLLVVWLLYALARQLFGRAYHTFGGAANAFGASPLSLRENGTHWLFGGAAYGSLAAMLFAVNYSHYEVVTYVSASDYTIWAAIYLATVLLFLCYLQQENRSEYSNVNHRFRTRFAYIGALIAYALLALGHDFTLSMPLVLLALHLLLYGDARQWARDEWPQRVQALCLFLRPHLPFWLLWAIHVTLQFTLVATGTSEAVYSAIGYAPGLHMLTNLRYLIFLLLPNVTIGPIYSFLSAQLSVPAVSALWQLSMVLGVLLHGLLLWQCWRGPTLIRVAIALIYLPFLQYTPWQGHFIEAPRYLLLPSVGWALFLAWYGMLFAARQRLRSGRTWIAALVVVLFCSANTAVIQIWIQQHVANGNFRRVFVTALQDEYYTVFGRDTQIWIEVPEEKYMDLAESCSLVFDRYYVRCLTYVAGESSPSSRGEIRSDHDFYWLEATAQGIVQRYPDRAISR